MKGHVWGWPIAGYLFLGGLGAGATILAMSADLFFGLGQLFSACVLGAFIAMALGCFLLIFELGVPKRFLRVFSWHGAVLNFGAWSVGILILIDFIYFTFWVPAIPWYGGAARSVFAVLAFLIAFGVLIYTGVELSSMKGRVFWNTPALPILFAVSGLLTGTALDLLLVGGWPCVVTPDIALALVLAQTVLHLMCIALIVATLITVLIYVVMMYTSSNVYARRAAGRWLKGSYAKAFWLGAFGLGLVVPLLCLVCGADAIACICVIAGGVFLRFLVVYTDDRRTLNGEERYWGRLPQGDEAFLKTDWT